MFACVPDVNDYYFCVVKTEKRYAIAVSFEKKVRNRGFALNFCYPKFLGVFQKINKESTKGRVPNRGQFFGFGTQSRFYSKFIYFGQIYLAIEKKLAFFRCRPPVIVIFRKKRARSKYSKY